MALLILALGATGLTILVSRRGVMPPNTAGPDPELNRASAGHTERRGASHPTPSWPTYAQLGPSALLIGLGVGGIYGLHAALGIFESSFRRFPGPRDDSLGLVALGVVALLLILWIVPKWQVASARDISPEDRFGAEQEARKTLAQILGGALVLITFYQTWANTRLTQDGQITTRFNQAIGHLGASVSEEGGFQQPQLELRVGGIYALERIGIDSPEDYRSGLEILTAYARRHAPRDKHGVGYRVVDGRDPEGAAREMCVDRPPEQLRPTDDIQAILNVIGRRQGEAAEWFVDLSNVQLRGACLNESRLRHVSFVGADARHVILTDADLGHADLTRARLTEAQLSRARLSRASFLGTFLDKAVLVRAWVDLLTEDEKRSQMYTVAFQDALLTGADLTEARLPDALLAGAQLTDARLEDANLERAQLANANLERAHLGRANLESACLVAAGLTGAFLVEANLHGAEMPGANLHDANLMYANLSNANLAGATLAAWLQGAILNGADLRGADLTMADGLTQSQLSMAFLDENTRIPNSLGPVSTFVRSPPDERTSEPCDAAP